MHGSPVELIKVRRFLPLSLAPLLYPFMAEGRKFSRNQHSKVVVFFKQIKDGQVAYQVLPGPQRPVCTGLIRCQRPACPISTLAFHLQCGLE